MISKHRLFISLCALSLSLTACGKKQETTKEPAGEPPTAPETAKAAPEAAKTAPEKAEKVAAPEPAPAPKPVIPEVEIPVGTPLVLKDVGFATPESVLYDPKADVYLVSNINGNPLEADDNGFISRVTPDGKVSALKWIDGASDKVTLGAPKGMAIHEDLLYVSDIDHLRVFHRETGVQQESIPVKGATFLNDVVSDVDGSIYFTDSGLTTGFKPSGSDAVYRRTPKGEFVALAKDAEMNRPNGLLAKGDLVWVVTFGAAEIFSVNRSGERTYGGNPEKGELDGLVQAPDGEFLISSWGANAIFKGPAGGPFETIISDVDAPADIGLDTKRGRLLIPLFKTNIVQIHALP